jgi:hypothetical protein
MIVIAKICQIYKHNALIPTKLSAMIESKDTKWVGCKMKTD